MRRNLSIFLAFVLLATLLVGLNAASYVQKQTKPDDERYPNRSTYHAGATGTRAFYELLTETGRKAVRWQEKPAALFTESVNKPQTFVVVGEERRKFTDEEVEQLLRWVSQGGKLVVIDRTPPKELLSTTANWLISAVPVNFPLYDLDPSDQQQMTEKTKAAKPSQPTVFTRNVNAVQTSRLAASIKLESFPLDESYKIDGVSPNASPAAQDEYYEEMEEAPSGQGRGGGSAQDAVTSNSNNVIQSAPPPKVETSPPTAPVVHLSNGEKNLLADFPYGSGQIVFLTDPYVVSNAGINLVDNAQLAINVVASRDGVIAFDEYHQGFGAGENRLFSYFAETPLPAIIAQILLLIAAVLFTQSRRFARALPAIEPNRLSKLEYVSAMAALQQRTRAYDLAIENIYTEFRRRAAKSFGVDNFTTPRKELAALIAERAKSDPNEVEELMRTCEAIIQGEPTNKREALEISGRLRLLEDKLGLKRTRKQSFGK